MLLLEEQIKIAAQHIQSGRLVAFPTETVYGLGANALDPLAVAKIFEAKERPSFDPLIVHIAVLDQVKQLIRVEDERIALLAKQFWPGPLTIVLPKSDLVPDIVTSGLDTVAVRMPDHDIALALIKTAGCPIAAPSANKFGRISPTKAAHVRKQLSKEVDYILDGGKTTVGIESTIIKLTRSGFRILRNGVISKEDISTLLPFDPTPQTANTEILAPGMIKSHYSPTKMMCIAHPELKIDKQKAGLISFSGSLEQGYRKVIRVSYQNDLKEYAVNIFDAMHQLEDDPEIELIVAEAVKEEGIGIAIMDRLKKAAHDWTS